MSPPGWEEYRRWRDDFAAILDPRFYTVEWLDGEVWSGRIRLFSDEKSAILVSLRTFPTGAFEAHVEAAAGELKLLCNSTIAAVEDWARAIGCVSVRIESREAWVRIMGDKGYTPYQFAIRKEL